MSAVYVRSVAQQQCVHRKVSQSKNMLNKLNRKYTFSYVKAGEGEKEVGRSNLLKLGGLNCRKGDGVTTRPNCWTGGAGRF